ncbi:MAG TPA: gluconate 2-dehydrogenase subunit 3 family protein [Paraburkholderia sp.]|jgi:hypothetical protein
MSGRADSRSTVARDASVLAKRNSPSWDAITRTVVDARLATPNAARFLGPSQWRTLVALCACVVPQRERAPRNAIPVAALVDGKLLEDRRDGFRDARLPTLRDAWSTGLAALDAECQRAFGHAFADLGDDERRTMVTRMQAGELKHRLWHGMPCDLFFTKRVLHDVCSAYYSHPYAWDALGFGGPANPRGYVRLGFDRRDPWEAPMPHDDNERGHGETDDEH